VADDEKPKIHEQDPTLDPTPETLDAVEGAIEDVLAGYGLPVHAIERAAYAAIEALALLDRDNRVTYRSGRDRTFTSRVVTARKTHACTRCGGAIVEGEQEESGMSNFPEPVVEAVMEVIAADDHWVYMVLNEAGDVIYVGITSTEIGWWPEVAGIRVKHFATRAEALAAEEACIRAHQPPYNTLHVERQDAA
jgi:hypothetical protein